MCGWDGSKIVFSRWTAILKKSSRHHHICCGRISHSCKSSQYRQLVCLDNDVLLVLLWCCLFECGLNDCSSKEHPWWSWIMMWWKNNATWKTRQLHVRLIDSRVLSLISHWHSLLASPPRSTFESLRAAFARSGTQLNTRVLKWKCLSYLIRVSFWTIEINSTILQ